MSPRFALVVVLLAGCDESDDREARPIVLPPAAKQKSTGPVDVSPLTPIVLPEVAVPPPKKDGPPPPPPQRDDRPAPEASPAPAPVAAPPEEKLVIPDEQKPPPLKKKKR